MSKQTQIISVKLLQTETSCYRHKLCDVGVKPELGGCILSFLVSFLRGKESFSGDPTGGKKLSKILFLLTVEHK